MEWPPEREDNQTQNPGTVGGRRSPAEEPGGAERLTSERIFGVGFFLFFLNQKLDGKKRQLKKKAKTPKHKHV